MQDLRFLGITFILFLFSQIAFSQCPIANSCTPGNAPSSVYPFGMGIYNVTVGSNPTGFSNPTSVGVQDGYQNYSCSKKATVKEGISTTISVSTNANSDENVRVWIDLNNNGTFEATSELVFNSNNARQHTGTFTIPVSAAVVKNTVLRMRVSADDNGSPIPTPCSTPKFSQVEDYGIIVQGNTSKPTVDFTVNNPITCSPTVQFSELTQNGATSFLWSFGDNTTSTAANPTHTYAAPGTYNVKLKACNANGCDSVTKTNLVTYHNNVPIAATCTPATLNYCCGFGITKITFGTLVNSSQNGAVGYENFTCTKSVTVEENVSYPFALETNPSSSQDTWAYIDYNNNGIFEPNELVFTKLNAINPAGNILIQTGTVKNTALRMRIISDAQGTASGACANRTSGQVEDYTIITSLNIRKPVATFNSNFNNVCDSLVQFSDVSLNGPTSFFWDFGDGSANSTTKNPQHKYTTAGSYTVKLKVCNAYGCDSITKQNYISYTKNCPTYCIPSYNTNNNLWITNVTLNTINNNTGAEPNAYGNYTALSTILVKGSSYKVSSSSNSTWGRTTTVWIDFNQDGDFLDAREKVATGGTTTIFSKTFIVPTTAKTGVTRMRVMSSGSNFTSCTNSTFSLETEDYSVYIIPNNQPPTALFSTFNRTYCNYTFAFADTSANSATSRLWNFGDPASGALNTSNMEFPQHTFSGPGTYTIKLIACNNFGCDTLNKYSYVTITGNNGPMGILCKPLTLATFTDNGISNVSFNTINYTTPTNDGYRDYACSIGTTVVAGRSYPISIKNGIWSDEDVRVWIDYNNDGMFNTVSELVFSSNFKKLHTGIVTIPNTAVLNKPLRMRVASEDVGEHKPPKPCDNVQLGQVEDYSILVVNPLGLKESNLTQNITIYPNPSSGIFYLDNTSNLQGNVDLKVFNILGQLVAEKVLTTEKDKQTLDLSHLQKGIYHLILSNQNISVAKKVIIE